MSSDRGANVLAAGIGLNTASPSYQYHAVNATNDWQHYNQATATSGNVLMHYWVNTGSAPDNNTSKFLHCQDSSANRCIIWADGDVNNQDNAYGSISDRRIKQGIRDSNSQWDDIKAVKVRNFKKNDDVAQYGDKAWEQIGVIAQELEDAGMDKLVREHPAMDSDIANSEEISEGDMVKSVQYSILYMKSVKALQEAMIRIEQLESKVAALEG